MREIKFRFYSKILNKFVIPQDSIFVGALKDPEMVVLQYSGLKDKNGVEIYEGDLVEEDRMARPQIVFYSNDHTAFMLGFNCDNTQYDKRERMFADCIKVIGNIYENPELLK